MSTVCRTTPAKIFLERCRGRAGPPSSIRTRCRRGLQLFGPCGCRRNAAKTCQDDSSCSQRTANCARRTACSAGCCRGESPSPDQTPAHTCYQSYTASPASRAAAAAFTKMSCSYPSSPPRPLTPPYTSTLPCHPHPHFSLAHSKNRTCFFLYYLFYKIRHFFKDWRN